MDKARWEEDYELIENEGLFEEYLEMGKHFIPIITSQSSLSYHIGHVYLHVILLYR